jgi:hypothetical protein
MTGRWPAPLGRGTGLTDQDSGGGRSEGLRLNDVHPDIVDLGRK